MWSKIKQQALGMMKQGDELFDKHHSVLSSPNMASAIANLLAIALDTKKQYGMNVYPTFLELLSSNQSLVHQIQQDLAAHVHNHFVYNEWIGFLSAKGFHALVLYRLTHQLWQDNKHELAVLLAYCSSQITSIELHPAASISSPICIDHGAGIVVGETSVIEKHVVLFQSVTLGSRLIVDEGMTSQTRHPLVREGAILGAGAKIIGPIEVGHHALVGAGSVVIRDVPAHSIVAGNPARIIGSMKNRRTSWSIMA